MDITLKNVKHSGFASHETSCFQADVYVDGKKAGRAENDGHGGMTLISPRELAEKLNAHGRTLPKKVSNIKDGSEPGGFFTYEQTGETLVGDLLVEWLIQRDVKKAMKTRVLFTIAGKGGIFQTKPLNTASMEASLKDPKLAEKLKAETILNLLPLDEATKIYRMRTGG
jgi:hypothetical protein